MQTDLKKSELILSVWLQLNEIPIDKARLRIVCVLLKMYGAATVFN